MKRNFTKEEMLKKHETNIKSATSGFVLSGVLGLIYIVRYIIKDNFDFYFSLSFTELMLRLSDAGSLSATVAYVLIAAFIAVFLALAILTAKNAKHLRYALFFYVFDFLCLIPLAVFHGENITSAFFIDVIVHIFVVLFISVGIISEKKKSQSPSE